MKTVMVLVCFLAGSVVSAVGEGAEEGGVREVRDVVWAVGPEGGEDLMVDFYLPEGVEKAPLVLFIHGGGWKNGDRKRCRLAWLAEHGYAVASVDYRLSHEGLFPAQIHDCKGALRWLRANAAEYGVDADRVVVAGTSAGGHLAALMGTSGEVEELEGVTGGNESESSRVQGIIDYFGPTDFVLRSKHKPEKTEEPDGSVYLLLGGPVRDNEERAKLASPVFHVTADDPPLLIVHGDEDKTVDIGQSERLAAVYEDEGLDVTLHVVEGAGHGWKGPKEAEREAVLGFLEARLGTPGG
ncbi:MAG: alpha/beta hydrolase [Verrucomicrobiota bacterium]